MLWELALNNPYPPGNYIWVFQFGSSRTSLAIPQCKELTGGVHCASVLRVFVWIVSAVIVLCAGLSALIFMCFLGKYNLRVCCILCLGVIRQAYSEQCWSCTRLHNIGDAILVCVATLAATCRQFLVKLNEIIQLFLVSRCLITLCFDCNYNCALDECESSEIIHHRRTILINGNSNKSQRTWCI